MRDLLVVVADQDIEETITGLLSRPDALEIRNVNFKVMRNVLRDPGCRTSITSLIRPFIRSYLHVIVIFDREGSGAERQTRENIEEAVENDLRINGWNDNAAVVVIDPELEAWVWSDSIHVDTALGWEKRDPEVRMWIKEHTNFWTEGEDKPKRPKEALHKALKEVRIPISASIFRQLSERVSVNRCNDQAFSKLKNILRQWFGT